MAAVELVRDKPTKEPFDESLGVGLQCMRMAIRQGLIVRALGDSIAFSPPLIVKEAEIDAILDRFGEALRATADWLAAR